MTTATIALTELAEKGADIDVLRQMVQFMAKRLMELDVEARCGAGYGEKNPEWLNSHDRRNGAQGTVCRAAKLLARGMPDARRCRRSCPPRRHSAT